MDKLKMESVDLTAQNIEKIGALFPNCITETADENGKLKKAINFDMLKQMLSDEVVEGDEAYEFTWVGKKEAIVEANKPIRKTLRPCKEESVNWDSTENLYIEGDNLEVLKLLQESYLGKVKMIYIDPPYNTGNDFIYNDDFKMTGEEYADVAGEIDEDGNRMVKNADTNGRFHSDWCSMIYSRLMLARNLLSDDGVIFISIDDNEVDNLRKICDEIFGSNNYIANLIWQSTPGSNTGDDVKTVTENILLYSKNKSSCHFLNQEISDNEKYSNHDEYYEKRGGYVLNKLDRRMTGSHYSEALNYSIRMPDGSLLYPGNSNIKQEH
jgi:adenine-specific DNA-methyltransferase